VTGRRLRLATWLSGLLWLASWLGIALEIDQWHHLTPALRLQPPAHPPGTPPPRPGTFLVTVLVSAVLAPLLFVTLSIVHYRRRPAKSDTAN
jgi:hypothetical protein